MAEVYIEKIENGYTIYINYKKHYIKNKKELIDFIEKELK